MRLSGSASGAGRQRGALVRALGVLALAWLTACSSPAPPDVSARVARAERGLENDPAIQAGVAEVEAAMARSERGRIVDEIELRVAPEISDDEDAKLRLTARVPLKHPGELSAERRMDHADIDIAVSRLEERALERRAELCLPAVGAAAFAERSAIYRVYAARQRALLSWIEEGQRSGSLNELDAAQLEIELRIELATGEPAPVLQADAPRGTLPALEPAIGNLVRERETIREIVTRHHPAVGVHAAISERYRALADRSKHRARPWLRFVDFSAEPIAQGASNEFGAQFALRVPLGGDAGAEARRYRALEQGEQRRGQVRIEEQLARAEFALAELHAYEQQVGRWQELLELADRADAVADRWWRDRLARPGRVADLFDEAFAARNAVVDARERAALARCTLLAMTGVLPAEWRRE